MFVCTDLLLHITVLVYTDLNHYNYIMVVEREIRGKYKAYTVGEKKAILEETKLYSTREVAKKYCMNEATIRRWRTQDLHLQRHKSGRRYGGGHPLSYPIELEQDIVTWVLQRRDKNLAVSRNSIQLFACTVISPHHPEFKASNGWVQKFMTRNNLTLRAKTSQSQKLPDTYDTDVRSFRDFISRNRRRLEPDFIMNMDETPFYFDNVPSKTVDIVGSKSVRVLTTGSDKKRCTVVLGISDCGVFLRTMVIFKGKRKLNLVHPDSIIVRVQDKAWMDERLMIEWMELCVRPFTERKPAILVLDSFRGHLTKDVNAAMKKINVCPAVIPGGCTSLLQPLDVSINKPMKDRARQLWQEYMLQMSDTDTPTKSPSKQQILDWIVAAQEQVNQDMICKSFLVTGITNKLDGSEDYLMNDNIRAVL